ncbi:hypothetical protein EDD86DRAFT_194776 [Gorgonomyces haynaldii]|nr:hypothetical protein EDD86DRAFT_194776 [Gorgonomyces haynaldii]
MQDSKWEETLTRIIPSIVSIRSISVRNFDTESQRTSQATGFVVDADQGLILTNRHVVQPGPILAEATFTQSKEEVKLIPVYRDPVHDFGFFRFDKTQVKYSNIDSIVLRPESARVGLDIRVVGNDAGERLSILGGTLARLDRQAPFYGNGKYNDWNTFYYQAASMTSGGSSGSPVIDINGCAIALNAGGATASASSFFLPLDRVVRALDCLLKHSQVPRGTIQTVFSFTTFDELRRLGLEDQDESELRKIPNNTGTLICSSVNVKGPASDILESGDILLKINDKIIHHFIGLEEILDSSVGECINVLVQRGTQKKECRVKIQDLHSITPSSFVEIGGAVVHELSYQMAVSYVVPTGSVFVASAGYMMGLAGIARKCVVESVNNEPTPDMESFIRVIQKLRDNERVPISHYLLTDINKSRVSIVHIDRRWHPFRIAKRNDETGLWDYTDMPPCSGEAIQIPHTAPPTLIGDNLGPAKYIVPSMVNVEFHMPFKVDGVVHQVHSGLGIVINHKLGLLITDRNAIPTSIGDVILTFANSIIIPGTVLYLHQTFNLCVVKYDPKLLGDTVVNDCILSKTRLKQNDETILVCMSKSYQPIVRKTVVTNIRQFYVAEPIPPTYRSMNVEGIELENPINNGGVLVTEEGHVQALYPAFTKHNSKQRSEFYIGICVSILEPILNKLIHGKQDPMYTLEAELTYTQIAHARTLGLTDEWVKKMEKTNNVVVVRRLTSSANSFDLIKTADIILSVDGEPVQSFEGVMSRVYQPKLDMTLLRTGNVIHVQVPQTELESRGTERLVGWAGAIFQMPHKAIYQQLISVPKGVLCSVVFDGSPAQLYGLPPLTWVTQVNDTPVTDLDHFLQVISDIKSDTFARLKIVGYNRFTKVITLRTNAHYFGSWLLEQREGKWVLATK